MRSSMEGYGRPTAAVALVLASVLSGLAVSAAGRPVAESYVRELQTRADELQLHEEKYWRLLLHFRPSPFGARSQIDDPDFFLAPDGPTNPRAELHATLEALGKPVGTNVLDHAACRFVARYAWLKERLAIDENRLPYPECAPFNEVYRHLEPTAVTLAFPAEHINDPASMFGHTLLVFDGSGKNRLLSRAINYAARIDIEFGPLFILGSFVGLFDGYYSVLPYYDKVEEYNDLGQRDVWEYELNFTRAEVARVLRHAWELQNVRSKYYFLTENCSYNLLHLLEAGRPELELVGRFPLWVIPVDTVKAVHDEGLVRSVTYRPSKASTIRHLASRLEAEQVSLALEVAKNDVEPSSLLAAATNAPGRRAALDLAAEYVQYLYAEAALPADVYRERLLDILKVRSKLGRPDLAAGLDVPRPIPPEEGHDPHRVSAGAGIRNGDFFQSVRYRPSYHELLDRDAGYDMGAQIQFVNTEVRFFHEANEWELQRLDLLDILSVSPRDRFFKPSAWKVLTGFAQESFEDDDHSLVYRLNTGTGHSYAPWGDGLLYAMVEADAQFGNKFGDNYVLGLGTSVGAIRKMSPNWKAVFFAKGSYFGFRDEFLSYEVGLDQNFAIGRNTSFSVRFSHELNDDFFVNEASLDWNLYF